ncbi:cellulose synthase (UDP-forming) [Burkholderia lata]|uniref:Cellulose synthase (UDP-forming) n=1 Tax=Burkholderia lata (strain ATCC 17760 / DSM 23089 / LMG 22485 / NCIMB 9086 / R18194 / 383) TaxID=482957 RepID=A0A6P2SV68_BURL3|nr:cellulose synthase catalytic subunit [Burkholderia lata]VWC47446.1 cellulose synthase (UDP-forming) [Burkholderia lata]
MAFYFDAFEHRRPPEPLPHSPVIESLWQFFAVLALVFGANYLVWRWTSSLNHDAMWFAVPLVAAETLSYVGLALFVFNLWRVDDYPQRSPPTSFADCADTPSDETRRPLKVDLFIATYNEDVELVRLSIRAARAVTYPHQIDYRIHVLDDGRRPAMREVAAAEGAHYITRDDNTGYKAGNLRHAMERTDGDFIVICDADTRVFPTILEHTLGYFRDPKVAWVQTPQWFFDLPEGETLDGWAMRRLGRPARGLARLVQRCVGPIRVGADPFVSDPQMFYDVIMRRRNRANAAFCCGAASTHRREAVMEAALRAFGLTVDREASRLAAEVADPVLRADLEAELRRQAATHSELTPYKFHVSEDIYTSIVLHGDRPRGWKSVMHPRIESKMLSPQDLLTWTIQRYKYAGGTLDIALHDNPLLRSGLTGSQRLMYLSTFWSYFGSVWNLMFLIAPVIYLLTNISPVQTYSGPFYWRFLPFITSTELAFMFGAWGIPGWAAKSSYLAFFPVSLRALRAVLNGETIKFPVTPKDRQEGNFLRLVVPQIAVAALTAFALTWATVRWALGANVDPASIVVNLVWGGNNILAMMPVVFAAFWRPPDEAHPTDAPHAVPGTGGSR